MSGRSLLPESAQQARKQLAELTTAPSPVLESLVRMRRRYASQDVPQGRAASVLMLFGMVEDQLSVLLTQRAATLRTHAGQVAFPGGAQDPQDADVLAAAVREAQEETGLQAQDIELLGALEPVPVPISGFLVTPVLAWWSRPQALAPVDPAETERVFTVSLAELAREGNRVTTALRRAGSTFKGPGFLAQDALIWGFTGFLLEAVLEELGWLEPAGENLPRIDPTGWLPPAD